MAQHVHPIYSSSKPPVGRFLTELKNNDKKNYSICRGGRGVNATLVNYTRRSIKRRVARVTSEATIVGRRFTANAAQRDSCRKAAARRQVRVFSTASTIADDGDAGPVDGKQQLSNMWKTLYTTQMRLMLRIATLGFPVLLSNLVDPTVSCVELMYAGVLGTLSIAAFAPIGSFLDAQTEVIAALGKLPLEISKRITQT